MYLLFVVVGLRLGDPERLPRLLLFTPFIIVAVVTAKECSKSVEVDERADDDDDEIFSIFFIK